MKTHYENLGADFSACTMNEEILTAIESFEDTLNAADDSVTTDERIASALEFLAVSSLDDAT
jgi:hypothetical protein